MATQKGALLLLKIKIENDFKTIGGMKTTKFTLNNQIIDTSNKSSGPWRNLLNNAGITSVTISGSGVFTDTESENFFKDLAFKNEICDYQLCFSNGDIISGSFQITSYESSGNYDQEENYALTLESAGKITLGNNSRQLFTNIIDKITKN